MRRRYRQKVLTKPLRKNIISVIATKFIIITITIIFIMKTFFSKTKRFYSLWLRNMRNQNHYFATTLEPYAQLCPVLCLIQAPQPNKLYRNPPTSPPSACNFPTRPTLQDWDPPSTTTQTLINRVVSTINRA